MKPKRIQRKRTKGWKMPEGAVVVSRPTKWGNPFSVPTWGLELALVLFRDAAHGIWNPGSLPASFEDWRFTDAHQCAARWRENLGHHPLGVIRAHLRGKDLACWCPLDQPCHADVLLGGQGPVGTPLRRQNIKMKRSRVMTDEQRQAATDYVDTQLAILREYGSLRADFDDSDRELVIEKILSIMTPPHQGKVG